MTETRDLFAYGTLMFPEIWQAVVGEGAETIDHQAASLAGYEIRRFDNYDFPGIYDSDRPDAEVAGVVYTGLTAAMIETLDQYEDAAYFRDTVSVQLGSGETIKAQTYVVQTTHRHQLSSEEWTADWFSQNARAEYFRRLTGLPMPN